ncbi:MAG: peptide-methionine (S)-S-oxide reductase, partial [Myxococcota bacterium]|nr:peptide-methionine (S)-S-oxide reductase [Myxococcota bacterium]
MAFFGSAKLRIPTPDRALPGRSQPMRVPTAHFVNGHQLTPPWPEGFEQAVFGMGC